MHYCRIVQSSFLQHGGKAKSSTVCSARLLHCTWSVTWKNVDCMHRTHNGGFELQKGQRLLSAVVHFTQNFIVNILYVEDAKKFPLYIQFTKCLLHITERLSVAGTDWASLRNLSKLLAQYMWDLEIPPTHCFTAVHRRQWLVASPLYSPWQEIIDPTLQQDHHTDDQNQLRIHAAYTHLQLNC